MLWERSTSWVFNVVVSDTLTDFISMYVGVTPNIANILWLNLEACSTWFRTWFLWTPSNGINLVPQNTNKHDDASTLGKVLDCHELYGVASGGTSLNQVLRAALELRRVWDWELRMHCIWIGTPTWSSALYTVYVTASTSKESTSNCFKCFCMNHNESTSKLETHNGWMSLAGLFRTELGTEFRTELGTAFIINYEEWLY